MENGRGILHQKGSLKWSSSLKSKQHQLIRFVSLLILIDGIESDSGAPPDVASHIHCSRREIKFRSRYGLALR